jgi:hypothetical protein
MSAGEGSLLGRLARVFPWRAALILGFAGAAVLLFYGYYVHPGTVRNYGHQVGYSDAMFGDPIAQPIPFSHRLHVTDKQIDCFYCHPFGERSVNAGLPSVDKCLGCHDYIIPEHEEIIKLRGYKERGESLPWKRVYYNPDHVFFPHFRHLAKDVACQECHGEVERADRLFQVTFYMGFCIDCHQERGASLECVACHQ